MTHGDGDGRAGEEVRGDRPMIVGIGASAGGLKALQAFFGAMPNDTGISFAVIMHLSPEHESNLAELLRAKTKMPVLQVTETVPIEPNHIYVIPPSKRLEATDHELSVHEFEEPRGRRAPIDLFFRSLATVHGEGAGILLSGGGMDGSLGIKSIKEAGGLVMVQDPREAEHDSMPRSAIATGLVDAVHPAAELAARLVEYISQPVTLPTLPDDLDADQNRTLEHILGELRALTGHDFKRYKRSTVLRRLQRRMQVTHKAQPGQYLSYMQENPEEAKALFKDLLISVTNFFRDPDSFEALREKVIPQLFEGKEEGDTVRVWTVGCCTGEEAYSVAILMLEHVASLQIRPKIQVFASDIDEGALVTGREGKYPLSIETDVAANYLDRYFVQESGHFHATKELRETVLFASHSVLRDPPFSRIDLILCRNVLIYVDSGLRDEILGIFHYALRPGGYLFLGRSEMADSASNLFSTIDKKHRLYQARARTGEAPILPVLLQTTSRIPETEDHPAAAPSKEGSEWVLHRTSLEEHAPPSLIVDEERNIVHLSERAGRYLQLPSGTIVRDVIELARPELRPELRAALFRAFERDTPTVALGVSVQFNGSPTVVYLTVRPVKHQNDAERLVLVLFDEDVNVAAQASEDEKATDQPADRRLEEELRHARERLQLTSEEFEASREEMQAQNEELRSINEEYRSTLEELKTSKEELQSVNEELETVNTELENKVEEVSRAHSDLQNLMEATNVDTLFLDQELRIAKYTPEVERHFNILGTDVGRPISHLTHNLEYDRFEQDLGEVLATLVPIEREIRDEEGKWYLVRLRPYRTIENKIEGVVATFVDISDLKLVQDEIGAAREYAESIVDTVGESLLVLGEDLRVHSANRTFYQYFETSPQETEGKLLYELGNKEWDIPDLRRLLKDILPQKIVINDYEIAQKLEGDRQRVMLLNACGIEHKKLILLAIRDVTVLSKAMSALDELNETLEERVDEGTKQVRELASKLTMAEQAERRRISQILHDDLQQLLYGVQMMMHQMLSEPGSEGGEASRDKLSEAYKLIDRAIATTRQLTVALSPPILKSEGLVESLSWLVTQMQEMHGLQVEVNSEHAFLIPDEDMRVLLFQIIRELLFNVVKHAGTDRVTVDLEASSECVIIRVTDMGKGFDMEEAATRAEIDGGFGFFSVRERLSLFGGRVEFDAAPGKGTQVTIYTPVKPLWNASAAE